MSIQSNGTARLINDYGNGKFVYAPPAMGIFPSEDKAESLALTWAIVNNDVDAIEKMGTTLADGKDYSELQRRHIVEFIGPIVGHLLVTEGVNNEAALRAVLKYEPHFEVEPVDFWNAFRKGYGKDLLLKLFTNYIGSHEKGAFHKFFMLNPETLRCDDFCYPDELKAFLGTEFKPYSGKNPPLYTEDGCDVAIEVGMRCTYRIGSDSYAYEVVGIHSSKLVIVRKLKATMKAGHDWTDDDYDYESDPKGSVVLVSNTLKRGWRSTEVSWDDGKLHFNACKCGIWAFGYAHEHRDPSF